MAITLKDWIDSAVVRYNQSWADVTNLMNHCQALSDQLNAHNWEGAAIQAGLMANDFDDLRDHLHSRRIAGEYYNTNALYWIDDNWPDGVAEVTMDSILNAMLTAKHHQFQHFIGLVDAYRVALWNEWFNVKYYAELARQFTFVK